MIIDRQNYEEFFMLYADRELSAADRQAVERFVQENPDLASELELFQQLQLPDETISFGARDVLYRPDAEDITAANHEEKFLLYVDDELDQAAKEKVEMFVLQHPSYQEAFTLLKQTKLPLETIVFADKASLYRKEEKRPVAYMSWSRMAAAAAFIGAAVLVWTLLPKDPSSTQGIAKLVKTPATGSSSTQHPGANNPESSHAVTAGVVNENAVNGSAVFNRTQAGNTGSGSTKKESGITEQQANQADLIASNTVVPPVAETKTTNTAGNIAGGADTQVPEKNMTSMVSSATPTADIAKNAAAPDEETHAAMVHNAVYKELDTDDEKKSLYVGSLEINKDKLRGFFRKAGSLFRGKSKQEEDSRTEAATPAGNRSLK